MPRTKKTDIERKRLEMKFLQDFKRKTALEIKKLQTDLKDEIKSYLNKLDCELSRFPPEIMNMTLGDIFDLMTEEDEIEDENLNKMPTKSELNSINSTDVGYSTDICNSTNTNISNTLKNKIKIGSKSAMKRVHSLKTLEPPSIYSHTPRNEKVGQVVCITPKVAPNTPINVLRQPRCGETVFSMTGSPILVSSILHDERMPNLMLPLHNGDVISVLPTGNLRESILPPLSPRTHQQLRTLKQHIEKFLCKNNDGSKTS